MTLCEFMQKLAYNQKLHCYVINAYDQNHNIGRGVRRELLDEDENDELFDHLLDEVDFIRIAKDNTVVVFVRDRYFNQRLEEQYSEIQVQKWSRFDKNSRPYLFSSELEEF